MGTRGPAGLPGVTGATGATGAEGPTGAMGLQGASGLNGATILSGSGQPTPTVGVGGDFYLETGNETLWGPKTASGGWGLGGISLVGATGATGLLGATGATGPTGPTGATGPTGPGYTFVTATGNPGPLPKAGVTYWVDVEVRMSTQSSPATGWCVVGEGVTVGDVYFFGSFNLPSNLLTPLPGVSISGVLSIPTVIAPLPLTVLCSASSGQINMGTVQWYVSPVQVTP